MYESFRGNRENLWSIVDQIEMKIKNLELSQDNPYFARIDFTSSSGDESTVYIGKNGVQYNSEIIVTDWRAPISSLYYDSEIGECSFNSPEGIVHGIMNLKRQYEIDNGELLDYFDVDLVSNDELLQKYLNSNNDSRLKSIVSTIQKEQNNVIRKKISKDIIVQGVAGSGKTTVALHRIAYLVYNYMKNIKQNQYLVIGPNDVFLKYIESVLPDLDVHGVTQATFEFFSKLYINENFDINSSTKKIVKTIANKNETIDIDKFKSSLIYKKMIELFLIDFFNNLTSKDLMLGDFKILDKSILKNIFNTTEGSLDLRIKITIDRICNEIEHDYDEIHSKYHKYFTEYFNRKKNLENINELRSLNLKNMEELSKGCRNIIRKYFSNSKKSILKIYKKFVENIEKYNFDNFSNIDLLKKITLENIKNNKFDFEDLAALIYIKSSVSPNLDSKKIKHVIVDEAQDLGEFNFWILKNIMPNATFSIFGDLSQSIYEYRGIDNWENVNCNVFNNEAEIINFNKSYRTTSEIMDVADDVAQNLGMHRSDLVVRHGEEVKFIEISNNTEIPNYIKNRIEKLQQKGYKTIAVISKTDLLSNYINDDLADLGLFLPNVTEKDDISDSKFNICTISNYLAKGLEFDAVIINNASEKIYSSEKTLDLKLLYVAITRALHELDIIYSGEINCVLKEKSKVLKR